MDPDPYVQNVMLFLTRWITYFMYKYGSHNRPENWKSLIIHDGSKAKKCEKLGWIIGTKAKASFQKKDGSQV